MLQTVRCIRFGEILMDENRRAFLLCQNCHSNYENLQEFRTHLECCMGLEHLFQQNTTIGFDCAKEASQLLGKSLNGAKQYLIYNFNEVQTIEPPSSEMNYKNDKNENYMDLIKIEEELLDPRWYTDIAVVQKETTNTADKILEYNELVEAVTPFVQFKENVKTSNESSVKVKRTYGTKHNRQVPSQRDAAKNITVESNAKARTQPIAKRRLSMQKDCQSNNRFITLPSVQPTNTTKLKMVPTDVLKQKLPTQKQAPKQIMKRRKTIAISMEGVQTQPELDSDISWKNDIAQILAKPKSNLKCYQRREKSTLPNASKIVSFKETAPTTTTRISTAPSVHHVPALLPPPLQQKPEKIVVTKSTPINVATSLHIQMIPPAVHSNEKKETEQILNKLQTLGLQIKRTNPIPPPLLAGPTKSDETLELLKKLQSKGMNVKIVNKNTIATNASQISKKPKIKLGSSNVFKSNFNKGIIIKKVK